MNSQSTSNTKSKARGEASIPLNDAIDFLLLNAESEAAAAISEFEQCKAPAYNDAAAVVRSSYTKQQICERLEALTNYHAQMGSDDGDAMAFAYAKALDMVESING